MLDFKTYTLFEARLQDAPGMSLEVLNNDLALIKAWYGGKYMHLDYVDPYVIRRFKEVAHRVSAIVGWTPKDTVLYRDVGWHPVGSAPETPVVVWKGGVSVSNKPLQSWTDSEQKADDFDDEIHHGQAKSKYSVVVSSEVKASEILVNYDAMRKFIAAGDNFFSKYTDAINNLDIDTLSPASIQTQYQKALPFLTQINSIIPFGEGRTLDISSFRAAGVLLYHLLHEFHSMASDFDEFALWGSQSEVVVYGPTRRVCTVLHVH